MATDERTLPGLFESSAQRFASNIFIWEKTGEKYNGTSYSQVRESVRECASGLIAAGVKRGDRIALISEGRAEWVVAELSILYAGAVNVPLSVKIEEPADLAFRLEHSGCRMAFASATQASKIRTVRDRLPAVEKLILFDAVESPAEGEVAFTSLLECGRQWLRMHEREFEERWTGVNESDPANICYTSGTVADPKGIVLTHRNYTANIEQSVALYPLPQWFVTLLILPWDHSFAHTDGIYAVAKSGCSLACVQTGRSPMETLRNIPVNIREVRPTFLLSVPALAKNFRKSIENGVRNKGPVARILFRLGMKTAFAYIADGFSRGKGLRWLLGFPNRVFDLILFRKIRESFGGRLQYFIGGGALLDIELQRFFYALGMPMYQGYGLTEAAPVISANTPARHKFGTSGALVPDLDLRICGEDGKVQWEGGRGKGGEGETGRAGEIVVKGENVMAGYWRNERATSEALRDGWLHTGDLGYMDEDGFLVVLGREKSLLIGHDGEKYSPEGIEETVVGNSLFIDQMMLYNNQSQYTVALLVPNRENLVRWAAAHRLDCTTRDGQDAVLHRLEKEIDGYRPGGRDAALFPERWLPSALAILEEPFTEQNRFLNSTLKMVRGRIAAAYGDRITGMFSAEGREICNDVNRRSIAAVTAAND